MTILSVLSLILLYIVDNLILPVLEEFKPDIIVNSAGQDNHYTDPLASMRISAQGYARLTEKLRPDLAVLEGGYSIEKALPYVNMAIILSLAGLDYSNVREPDYWPGRFKETSQRTEQVKRLVDELLPNHFHTIIMPDHIHNIQYGIYLNDTIPSFVDVRVDGKLIPELSLNENKINLIPYLQVDGDNKITRGAWHEISITPDSLARIEANIVSQIFIQSRGGGNY
jgi:hypothetical protein